MKILICGSRDWFDWDPIEARMSRLPAGSIIVHGDAPSGADRIADHLGQILGFEVRPYPADWKRHGRGAGPIRNRQMLEEETPDLVLAYWKNSSRGTRDMIDRARDWGITVEVYTPSSPLTPIEYTEQTTC